MSLRHLFSSELGETTLKMSYVGPVINQSGKIEDSPDGLILDKRNGFKVKRCEFKLAPIDEKAFKDNGQFDLAVVWELPKNNKDDLLKALKMKHGCEEILILNQYNVFRNLSPYNIENISAISSDQKNIIKNIAINTRNLASVYVSYIAAKIAPSEFNYDRMLQILKDKLPSELKGIQPKGISNVITRHMQTKVPLIKKKRAGYYQWNPDLNPEIGVTTLADIIKNNFNGEIPDKEVIDRIK